MTQDQNRRRARQALTDVQSIADPGTARGYKGYIKSVPAHILSLGLGQALAVLLARGGNEAEAGQGGRAPEAYPLIFDHVTYWLFRHNPMQLDLDGHPVETRIERMALITQLGQQDYLNAQAEALAYLEWLKRFANAFLAPAETPDPSEDRS